jgi:hypothetical protein
MALLVLFLLAASAAAAIVWKWGKGSLLAEPASVLVAVSGLFLILLLGLCCVVHMLSDSWSFVRLSASVAMLRGYPLYYPQGEGPLLGWSYGPVMPLLQMPAAALPNPVAALVAAGVLNEAMLLLPLLLLFWRVTPASLSNRAIGILILAGLQALMMHSHASLYWFRQIQVDTFSMGFALLSWVVLLGAEAARPISLARLWASALLLCAAIFSKQNEIFLAPIPVTYVWVRDDRRKALQMVFAILMTGALGFLLCDLAFGWNAVFLNMWMVPARHPWTMSGARGFFLTGLELYEQASHFVILFACLVLLDYRFRPRSSTFREWVLTRPWILPAAAAVLIMPISLMGKLKAGGDNNSYHPIYFLAAAIGMMAPPLMSGKDRLSVRMGILSFSIAVLGTIFFIVPDQGLHSLESPFRNSRLETEYRFSLQHPEEVYFSADPLATLYSDRKLYHQGYGVYDRILANLPIPRRQLREHLPAKLRWAASPGSPWWVPDGLTPIAAPQGLEGAYWSERRVPR